MGAVVVGRAEARHGFSMEQRMLMSENDTDTIEAAVKELRSEWTRLRIAFFAAALALMGNGVILLARH